MISLKSRDTYSLIPGMASIMEDEDLDVDVNVEVSDDAAEDVAEDIAEEETAEEATEAEAESEQTEEAVEMTLRKFSELENALDHVKQYGVDRSFVSLMNYDDTLGRVLRVSFPSVESMDATGDPYSRLSQNTIAGLEAVLATAWEWIKQLCQKIINAFKKAATWVVDLAQGYERKLRALEKKADDAEFPDKWSDDVPASEKVIATNAVVQMKPEAQTLNNTIAGQAKQITELVTELYNEDDTRTKSELKEATKSESKFDKNYETVKSAFEAAKAKLKPTLAIKTLPNPLETAKTFIKQGFDAWDSIKDARSTIDIATKAVQQVYMEVAKLDSKKQTKGRSRAKTFIAKKLSQLQRTVSLQIAMDKDMCSTCIKSASAILKYSDEKETD